MGLSIFRRCALGALLFLIGALPCAAQDPDHDRPPIGRFALDARGVYMTYPGDEALSTFLDVARENLATRGLGVAVGAHVYPIRFGRRIALGFGGELLFSRGSKTLKPQTPDDDGEEVPDGPTVKARVSGLSPQLSLNFGGRDGWSYLSGGIGWTKFSTEVKVDTPATPTPPTTPTTAGSPDETPRTGTINYGGGARWFMKRHLAFTLDLRFYAIRPREATTRAPALPRTRLLLLSGGVSFK